MYTFTYYVAFPFIFVTFSLLAFRFWFINKKVKKREIKQLERKFIEDLALGNWETCSRIIESIKKRRANLSPELSLAYLKFLRKTEKFALAHQALRKLLKRQPDDPALLLEKGALLFLEGEKEEALKLLEGSKSLLKKQGAYLTYLECLIACQNYDKAWVLIQTELEREDSAELNVLASRCAYEARAFSEALSYMQRAEAMHCDDLDFLRLFAKNLMELELWKDAERRLKRVLKADPNDLKSLLDLGSCYEQQGLFAQALLLYQESPSWDDGEAHLLRQAGICAVHTKNYDFAILYLGQALKQGQNFPGVMKYLAYAFEQELRWEEAEKVYLKILEEFPDELTAYRSLSWMYGVGLTQQLSEEKGLEIAKKSLDMAPDVYAWEVLSACEARSGNFERAHLIQERLSAKENDRLQRQKRHRAMRCLRKQIPLSEEQVQRVQVA